MATTQLVRPDYFNNQFLEGLDDVEPDRRYTDDELCDIYGFVDGVLENGASSDSDILAEEIGEHAGLVDDFAGTVEDDELRYDFKGESGAPDHIGKKLAGDRKSREMKGGANQQLTSDQLPDMREVYDPDSFEKRDRKGTVSDFRRIDRKLEDY